MPPIETDDGVAVVWIRRNGAKLTEPLPPAPNRAVSHGAALGPSLQPHQLLVTVAAPASSPVLNSPVPPALPTCTVLLATREKLILRLPRPTRIPPPPKRTPRAESGDSEFPMTVILLAVVVPVMLPLINNPPPPADPLVTPPETLFLKTDIVSIETVCTGVPAFASSILSTAIPPPLPPAMFPLKTELWILTLPPLICF